ncbi:MAG: hypothetical protein MJ085_05625 [Clostridia bacterium]|nr:hypothetical protein [Clostridia bacterium]
MLKILIKKQFYESFRSYFVDQKTQTARSKGKVVSRFVLFGLLMLFLCGAFFAAAAMLGHNLIPSGDAGLYFSFMGIMAILFGTFGSAFNTFATLYLSKDNDLLLSMPIPPKKILLSRMALCFGLALLYSGIVWLPAIVYSWFFSPSALSVMFGILLLLVIVLFVTVISCALGWVVALISTKLKNKSFLVVILSIGFFVIYYSISARFSSILKAVASNAEKIGQGIKLWANPLWQLGEAAAGKIVPMLIFTGITAALFAACYLILSRSFAKIIAKNTAGGKKNAKRKDGKAHSVRGALYLRELKRFTASPTYMLNCGFGIAVLLILPIVVLVKKKALAGLLETLFAQIPAAKSFVPLALLFALGMITVIDVITTPSVSLEGQTLWQIRSLPVSTKQALKAKLDLHFSLNVVPTVLSAIVIGLCLKITVWELLGVCVLLAVIVRLIGAYGLMVNLKRPNLTWTSESMPIKQSINPLLVWLVGWGGMLVICGGFFLLQNILPVAVYLLIWIALTGALTCLLERRIFRKGAERFEALDV